MKQSLFKYIKERVMNNKLFFSLTTLYTLFCIITCIYSFINTQIRNGLLSALFFIIPILIYIIEYLLHIKLTHLVIFISLLICSGSILGCCYNFYTTIPILDTFLHGLSGFLFPCVGYSLIQVIIEKNHGKKHFYIYLMFSITFSLSISVIWEIFEYLTNVLLGYDMMEDTLINHFNSYLLSNNHNDSFAINDIEKTIIHYSNNLTLVIPGYLDIGLIDTLHDLMIHFSMTLIFALIATLSHFKCPKLNYLLIDPIRKKKD